MSLHSFLARLIWLCVLPLILLASYLAIDSVRATQSERDRAAANLARDFAAAIDQDLNARIRALRMLAASPLATDDSRRGDLYQEAQGFRESFGSHVILADLQMQMLFNTRVPFGAALPRLPIPKGQAAAPTALQTGAPAVGDILFGPVAKEPLVAIAVPGRRGETTAFVLLTTFETNRFQERLDQVALPSGWSFALLDGTGAAIARRAPPDFNAATDVDAAGRFVVKSAVSPWSVMLEIPRDIYRAPLLAAAAALAILILGATVAGILGGMLGSRRLAKSIASLASPPVPGAPPPRITEIATLRRLLDEAAEKHATAVAALRESERYNRLLFDSSPIGLALCRMDGALVDVNPAYAAILGRSVEETLHLNYRDITPQKYAEQEQLQLELLRTAGRYGPYEKEYIHADGHLVPICLNGLIIARSGEQFVWSSVEDITERKRADALLSGENSTLEMIASAAPLAAILERIARTVETISSGTLCSIQLLDADGVHVRHGAAPSLPDDFNRSIDGLAIGPNAGSCGTAAYRNQQVIVTDIATDPLWTDYRALALPHGLRACWSTPVRTGDGRVLGTFALYYHEPRTPSQADLELIERLTHMTSIAIERKRAEDALRESERNYRKLFEANPHPMWVYDLETLRFLAVNDAAAAHYGYTPDQFLAMTIADIRPAKDVPQLLENIAGVEDEGLDKAGVWAHRKQDGTLIDVEITSHLLDFRGRRAEMVLAHDITERKAAEAKIHRLTQLYTALSQCNEAIVRAANEEELFPQVCRAAVQFGGMKAARVSLVDIDTRMVRVVASFGYGNEDLRDLAISIDADSLLGHGPTGTAIRENRPYWCQDFMHEPLTAPWHERGARLGWGSVAALPLHRSGAVIGAFVVFDGETNAFDEPRRRLLLEMAQDISYALDHFFRESGRRKAEAALRESDARYRALFEGNPLPIFAIDKETLKFLTVNPAAIEKYGYSREEFLAMTIADLQVTEDRARVDAELRERYAHGPDEITHLDRRHVTKSGRVIFANVVAQPLILGSRQARLISVSDVTERNRHENELLRLNEDLERRVGERTHALQVANRELEAFSYSVSHDLRAPLRAIDGFSQLIENGYAAQIDERGRELLGRVRAGTARMGCLIEDLLRLSQISRQTIHVSPVDLSVLARQVADELQAGEPMRRVEWVITPGVTAEGDAGLLKAVLQNLIGNAWKYSAKRDGARIEFGVTEEQGCRVYFVRDNGAGFNMAYAGKLFGAFQRLHPPSEFPGTGIGLATVARVIHRHGGEVRAEGRVGEGASFYFTLAAARQES